MKFITFATKNGWKSKIINCKDNEKVDKKVIVYKANFGFNVEDEKNIMPLYIDNKNKVIVEASPVPMSVEYAKDIIKSSNIRKEKKNARI